jgi:hypothetical protein
MGSCLHKLFRNCVQFTKIYFLSFLPPPFLSAVGFYRPHLTLFDTMTGRTAFIDGLLADVFRDICSDVLSLVDRRDTRRKWPIGHESGQELVAPPH